MNNYNDFKKVSLYMTYIKNIKWLFNFMKDRIIASTDVEYNIYERKSITKDVSEFDNYKDCFIDLMLEIKNLELCKNCNRLDEKYCRKCKLDEVVDNISYEELENEQCPVCYKNLTMRYVHICDDIRHKICCSCYHKINESLDVLCPICRQNSEDF